jgi:transglutaminase-like putative cysteine protease
MIACGALALFLAGGMGLWLATAFAAVLVAAWKLEGTKWLVSERVGLLIVLLSLPLFYLDWSLQSSALGVQEHRAGVSALVHLTLFLSSVKLLQVKADRDWLFLYLISFFEVLLAAGLSISPLFIVALGLYLFFALLTIVCFELRKAGSLVPRSETRLLVAQDSARFRRRWARRRGGGAQARELRRLPLAALCLLMLIFALALPIFFVTPRFGDNALAMAAGSAATGYVGFSDQVTLGDVGRLQKSDRLVMRVRVEEQGATRNQNLRWRGIALDRFSGRTWERSSRVSDILMGNERELFQLGTTENLSRLTTQTFFIEPIDTPVIFAAPRVVAVQGALPYIRSDKAGGTLTSRLHTQERITYRAYSDTLEPAPEILRADYQPYPSVKTPQLQLPIDSYRQLPDQTDPRIAELARSIISRAGARNRYDMARAVEAHLNRNELGGAYSYSLNNLPAGDDPLADFLFRLRAGHCEFFSTAMAVMLRTQGVASRVVNGFQMGAYNDAADAYIVRQQDAHSWVEVYFPETDAWVTFDPTPIEGRPSSAKASAAQSRWHKYAEALDLFWIQYVVAYDRQEQRTLAGSLRGAVGSFRRAVAGFAGVLKATLKAVWSGSPESGQSAGGPRFLPYARPSLFVVGAVILLVFLIRRLRGSGFSLRSKSAGASGGDASAVIFYERMMKVLEGRGLRRAAHQTPLEFAVTIGVPEALTVTRAYNSVRYGAQALSPAEVAQIEQSLRRLEEAGK